MSAAAHALEMLAKAASEYDARPDSRDVVFLAKLGLFVRIRQASVSSNGGGAVFIGQFEASTGGKAGIGVVCVGIGSDPADAATNASAQWCLGVLPVLADGRGDHTCFTSRAPLEVSTASGPLSFEVIRGPIIERGEHDGGTDAAPPEGGYLSLLADPLQAAGLGDRLHWLECFAIRMADGEVNATCRLDNRDWGPGQRLLDADARGWPGKTSSYHSRRQFLLLLPHGSWPEEPEPRSLWGRIFGGASAR